MRRGVVACVQKPPSLAEMVRLVEEQLRQCQQAGEQEAEGAKALARILLADDHEELRWGAKQTLELTGYEVMEVSDTEAALLALQAGEFDLIVADLLMPGGGARRIFQELASRHRRPPVVVMSGRLDQQTIRELQALGAAGWLAKPFPMKDLVALVGEALGRPPSGSGA